MQLSKSVVIVLSTWLCIYMIIAISLWDISWIMNMSKWGIWDRAMLTTIVIIISIMALVYVPLIIKDLKEKKDDTK